MNKKRVLAIVLLIAIAVVLMFSYFQRREGAVKFEGARVSVEIADQPVQQIAGLMGRTGLKPNSGMLFVFSESGNYPFWMGGMLFPLDIIWLNKDGAVVYMVEDVKPCPALRECPEYAPRAEALYVLELPSGYAREHHISEGAKAEIELPL